MRALRSQQRHGHSLSRGTAGSSPLHTVTSSPGKGDGDQRRDPPSFPRTGEPRAVPAGTEPAPAPRFTRIFPALRPHPWAVPAPSHTALPADRAPGMSGQPPLPPDFLRDSSTPEENQYFSTHRRQEREKAFHGKGDAADASRMPHPSGSPSSPCLSAGCGKCHLFPFPHRNRRRAELCSHLRPRGIHTPGAGCRFGSLKASKGSVGAGVGSFCSNGEDGDAPSHCTSRPKFPSLCRAGSSRERELFQTQEGWESS